MAVATLPSIGLIISVLLSCDIVIIFEIAIQSTNKGT